MARKHGHEHVRAWMQPLGLEGRAVAEANWPSVRPFSPAHAVTRCSALNPDRVEILDALGQKVRVAAGCFPSPGTVAG